MNIRIRPELSLAFPSSDIVKIEELPQEPALFRITATFLGLYGVSSPLPTFYTEDLFAEAAEDESVSRDFLDIFNHRLYLLFFRCLMKYRYFLQIVEERAPQFLEILFCLIGLGEKEFRRGLIDPYSIIRYAGLITQFPHSVMGLKTLIQDALSGIPVDIIPCVERKVALPVDQRLCVGVTGSRLGVDAYLGDEIEDRMGSFRISIGPLHENQFHSLLPGRRGFEKLNSLIHFYLTDPLEYDIETTLIKEELEHTCLGSAMWSSLGLDTWVYTDVFKTEPSIYFQP